VRCGKGKSICAIASAEEDWNSIHKWLKEDMPTEYFLLVVDTTFRDGLGQIPFHPTPVVVDSHHMAEEDRNHHPDPGEPVSTSTETTRPSSSGIGALTRRVFNRFNRRGDADATTNPTSNTTSQTTTTTRRDDDDSTSDDGDGSSFSHVSLFLRQHHALVLYAFGAFILVRMWFFAFSKKDSKLISFCAFVMVSTIPSQ